MAGTLKSYCRFRNQYPQHFEYTKLYAKTKIVLTLKTKKTKKMLYFHIFGLEFQIASVIFEANAVEFV